MNRWATACGLALCALALASCRTPRAVGVTVQDDAHVPLPWHSLTAAEQKTFDLGYATFNTEWAPANTPPGRTDGLGPLFNAQSCDACHNSRRRGRGPKGEGEAPSELVIQLGRQLPDGRLERGIAEYGRVLNTAAIRGFQREASVIIHYDEVERTLADGTRVHLRAPRYETEELSGPPLPAHTVLMPRMPPTVQGVGLLERVPESELATIANSQRRASGGVQGRVPMGRFGWQATEPSVASQTASAMSREMGLTTPLISGIDCGRNDRVCESAESGGAPEVEPTLFVALVTFQQLHAVPATKVDVPRSPGETLFTQTGCAACHRSTLRVDTGSREQQVIHPYTDLLLHELGSDLADRDIEGNAIHSEWRTAPLWGIQSSVASGQPLRLLHDGRARSIEEAVIWHDGEARSARANFTRLPAEQRKVLLAWIAER